MFIEANYHDRLHEFRQNDLERAWRRRELVRRARANQGLSRTRLLVALRAVRRRTSTAEVRTAGVVSSERTIPWSA